MDFALVLFIVTFTLEFTVIFGFMWRNNQVFKYRNGILDRKPENFKSLPITRQIEIMQKNLKEYKLLPSYGEMMKKFWIPVNKFNVKERVVGLL